MAAYPVRYRKAVTYVAVDGSFAGFLALSDTLRQESAETIAALSNLGVQPVLLTGDHETQPGPSPGSCRSARCGQTACRRIS